MKIAATIARSLMGLLFTVFGLNGFLHFIPQPPPVNPLALQYLTVLSASHYFVLIFLFQLSAGLMLLANRFVPLAVAFLAPIIVNILLYHFLLDPGNVGVGLVAAICWVIVFFSVRDAFAGVFRAQPAVTRDVRAAQASASA